MYTQLMKDLYNHLQEVGTRLPGFLQAKNLELVDQLENAMLGASKGVEAIAAERSKQIQKHGYTPQYDATANVEGQLVVAAAALLLRIPDIKAPKGWFEDQMCKMKELPDCEFLAIAGALIAAHLDRCDYVLENTPDTHD